MYQDLLTLIQPIVESLGFELWGLEYKSQTQGRALLRVYIANESGILVEDCEAVSRQISRVFDVEDPIRGEYTLEVSSPGMDPFLFYPDQYRLFCGEIIEVKLHQPQAAQKNFKGKLVAVDEDSIEMEDRGSMAKIRFENIKKARVVSF